VERLYAAALAAALVASACAPLPPPAPRPESAAPALDEAYYRDAAEHGRPVYRIEPGESLVLIRVHRGGRLASMGHDHVVSSREPRGFIDPQTGRCDLYVPVESLVVDDPAQRAAAGFDSTPSESDIAGTRSNMLDKVLEAERFPFVVVRVGGLTRDVLEAQISLHGVTRPVRIPAKIDSSPERIGVTGSFALKQTDFGIQPFSVLGGALTVQDDVELSFALRAVRMPAPG
jgi:YceI-like domain